MQRYLSNDPIGLQKAMYLALCLQSPAKVAASCCVFVGPSARLLGDKRTKWTPGWWVCSKWFIQTYKKAKTLINDNIFSFFFRRSLISTSTQPKKKKEIWVWLSPHWILICKPVAGCAVAFHSILQVFDWLIFSLWLQGSVKTVNLLGSPAGLQWL